MLSLFSFIFVREKLWWTYILQKGDDKMNELYHYGILSMKWGVRRYQNSDGTLTAKGKKKYSESNRYTTKNDGKIWDDYGLTGMKRKL